MRPLTRRAVLTTLAALPVVGCKNDPERQPPDPDPTSPSEPTTTPEADWVGGYREVLLELQGYLRASADHRVGRAEALVATGDPAAILDFVQRRIVWHPGWGETPYDGNFLPSGEPRRTGVGVTYGARGALRAGGGSALDRALLLQDLLQRAGFTDVEIVWADLDVMRPEDPADLFLGHWERPAAEPPIPDEAWDRWAAALGVDLAVEPDQILEPVDVDGSAAEALANRLLAVIDPDDPTRGYGMDWNRTDDAVPLVRFRDGSGERFANCVLPNATLDAPGLGPDDLVAAPELPPPLDVAVRLEMRTSASPDEAIVLVEGAYTADQLVGRQLSVATLPVTDARGLVTVPVELHRVFQTALLVQALDGGDDVPEPVTGLAVALGGEVLEEDGDGRLLVDGVAIADATTGTSDPADVTDVQLEIDGTHFPKVYARAWPRDASGAVVEGLGAGQMVLSDEGTDVPFLLRANREAPVVTLLRDTSASMPDAYRGAEGAALLRSVADEVEAMFPSASTRIEDTGSYLWDRLADAASEGPNVVVFLTDGDVRGELTPEIEAALLAGPPAILVAVDGAVTATLQQMADLTGGTLVPITDVAQLADVVIDEIGELELPPYQLAWDAPRQGPSLRQVRLSVGAVAATGTYEATPLNAPRRILALDVVVTVEGQEHRRTIGGWGAFAAYPTDPARLDELHEEVRAALLGGLMISFEGDGVSPSIALDDLVTTRLATLPWLDVAERPLDELLELVDQGLPMLPATLLAGWQPLQDDFADDTLTWPGTLRVTLIHTRGGRDGNQHAIHDILPLSRWRTVTRSGDERESFEANLRRTASMALLEDALGDESTVKLLDGLELIEVSGTPFPNEVSQEEEDLWEGLLRGNFDEYRLAPVGGAPRAFFHVDRRTGALTAVMPDGSGGADRIIEVLQIVDHAVAIYSAAAGANPALSVVAAYGITLVRLYAAVCTVLEGFVTEGLEDDVRCALERFACEALTRIAMPPMLKALNRLSGVTLGASLCDAYDGASGCG